uniref:Uncharacterized protein n=1 Tax=Arundo donax TaxID=35708 RepID=A0A0A9GVV2_ARUDO
MARRNSRR